mmetsp:Transcript_26166/g.73957  ORF Transcript_26166/g.73957 Transcript_26166/m.73957 type:complete len:266 (+) Transcript_26166:1-798(+)
MQEKCGSMWLPLDPDESSDNPKEISEIKGNSKVKLRVVYLAIKPLRPGRAPDSSALLSLKIYDVAHLSPEDVKGARIRLQVGRDEYRSKKCKPIQNSHVAGVRRKTAHIIQKLRHSGTSESDIAEAFELDIETVQSVLRGSIDSMGWNQTLHVLVRNPWEATVQVQVFLKDKAYNLVPPGSTPGTKLDELSRHNGAREVWAVRGHKCSGEVGLAFRVQQTCQLMERDALKALTVGMDGLPPEDSCKDLAKVLRAGRTKITIGANE